MEGGNKLFSKAYLDSLPEDERRIYEKMNERQLRMGTAEYKAAIALQEAELTVEEANKVLDNLKYSIPLRSVARFLKETSDEQEAPST